MEKRIINYPPIITVGNPPTIIPPCMVGSPIRMAGFPPINTVVDPIIVLSGGPTHIQLSPKTDAGSPPISTVGIPGPIIGPPTCGTNPVTIGQVCISVIRAAGGIIESYIIDRNTDIIRLTI